MAPQLSDSARRRSVDHVTAEVHDQAVHRTRIRAAFWVQKYVTMLTFICGMYLNLSLIFFGGALTLSRVFTRSVDLFLLANMIVSTVLGWYVLRHVRFTSTLARRFQIIILTYFVMLCLVHSIVIQMLGNITLYINTFLRLPGYPYIATVIFIAMLAFTAHLQLKVASRHALADETMSRLEQGGM